MSDRNHRTPKTLDELARAADAAAEAIAAWKPPRIEPTYSAARRERAVAIRDSRRPAPDHER